ncbi:MAG: cytochrome b/b6 domain-containing protein [Gammaproteobacteria bacterium]|nr:cytochrome b/b6 domain-containing protein [Gammaproteobacteria bacterium]MCY4219318.1 cytochrome b/b6 domain-containing protein [Gammaproteobacteria bacterium]MCY4276010.1 cytochrome b/b6 domain-containing protein [Gammaproteobacteria bacterium]
MRVNRKQIPKGYTHEQVWGIPIRIWHWLLVVSVISGWLLGEFRTFSIMQWHFYAGYCTGGLLFIRILFGIWGPYPVRFSALISGPQAMIDYVGTLFERHPSGSVGHSPIGGFATLVILICLAWQFTTGLMSVDDGLFFEGPLATWVSSEANRTATRFHHYGAKAILVLFLMHIGIMLFYKFWKHENLALAMITGRKLVKKIRP